MEAVSAYCLLNPQLTGKKGVLIILTSVYVPPILHKQTGLENREINHIGCNLDVGKKFSKLNLKYCLYTS